MTKLSAQRGECTTGIRRHRSSPILRSMSDLSGALRTSRCSDLPGAHRAPARRPGPAADAQPNDLGSIEAERPDSSSRGKA
eukprot:6185732-Pleurochrysis_carterae.AAC.1